MKRAAALTALLVLAGCAGGRIEGTRPAADIPSGPSAATVFENRTFKLSKTPDPELELALEGILSSSYEAAVNRYSGGDPMDIGFTYSMSPKGAIYPFSEIEVSCIMQQKYAGKKGPALCADFFAGVTARIKEALERPQAEAPQEEE